MEVGGRHASARLGGYLAFLSSGEDAAGGETNGSGLVCSAPLVSVVFWFLSVVTTNKTATAEAGRGPSAVPALAVLNPSVVLFGKRGFLVIIPYW